MARSIDIPASSVCEVFERINEREGLLKIGRG